MVFNQDDFLQWSWTLFPWLAHFSLPWLTISKLITDSSVWVVHCVKFTRAACLIEFTMLYKQSFKQLQMTMRQCIHKNSSLPLTSMYLVPRWCLCLFNASSLCSPFSNLINASPFLLPWAFKQKAIPPLIIMIKKTYWLS